MRIVVIGGNGFIGSNIVRYFCKNGHSVVSCDSRYPRYVCDGVEYISVSDKCVTSYEDILQPGDYVILLRWYGVAATSVSEQIVSTEFNIIDTMRIMEICARKQVHAVVFSSSGGTVYGIPQYIPIDEGHPTHPLSLYGNQKLMIENYIQMVARLNGLRAYVLRISNPYGPGQEPFRGQGVIATFLADTLMNRPIEIWGKGTENRDYVYIDDLAECFEKLIAYAGDEVVFNVGSGIETSINQIIESVEMVTGKDVVKIYKQEKLCQVSSNVLNCKRAEKELDWKAHTKLNDGIKKMKMCWDEHDKCFRIQ